MIVKQLAVVLGLVLMIVSCYQLDDKEVRQDIELEVKVIYSSQYCGRSSISPRAFMIDNPDELELRFKQIHKDTLGYNSNNLPVLNFQNEIALLVEMGQKPTLGYRLELVNNNLLASDGGAYISMNWVAPKDNAYLAQMISSPCLLLKLDRGDYESVLIKDSKGNLRVVAD